MARVTISGSHYGHCRGHGFWLIRFWLIGFWLIVPFPAPLGEEISVPHTGGSVGGDGARLCRADLPGTLSCTSLIRAEWSLGSACTGVESLARIPQLLPEVPASVQICPCSRVSHFKQTKSLDHCLLSGLIIFSLSLQPGLDEKKKQPTLCQYTLSKSN